jgi:hypothetical protein
MAEQPGAPTPIIGTRSQAKNIKKGVGGKTFPNDYNWICSVGGGENRAYQTTCM